LLDDAVRVAVGARAHSLCPGGQAGGAAACGGAQLDGPVSCELSQVMMALVLRRTSLCVDRVEWRGGKCDDGYSGSLVRSIRNYRVKPPAGNCSATLPVGWLSEGPPVRPLSCQRACPGGVH
jgi:hypothetical protein